MFDALQKLCELSSYLQEKVVTCKQLTKNSKILMKFLSRGKPFQGLHTNRLSGCQKSKICDVYLHKREERADLPISAVENPFMKPIAERPFFLVMTWTWLNFSEV